MCSRREFQLRAEPLNKLLSGIELQLDNILSNSNGTPRKSGSLAKVAKCDVRCRVDRAR